MKHVGKGLLYVRRVIKRSQSNEKKKQNNIIVDASKQTQVTDDSLSNIKPGIFFSVQTNYIASSKAFVTQQNVQTCVYSNRVSVNVRGIYRKHNQHVCRTKI